MHKKLASIGQKKIDLHVGDKTKLASIGLKKGHKRLMA